MSTDNLNTARQLYDALAAQDAGALIGALSPDFRGCVAEGMPDDLGGTYEGAESMLRDCWARVFALFDVRPVPQEFLDVGVDRIIVIGCYQGTARATGRPLAAAFAHLLRCTDGRVSELIQITDTARWRDAIAL